MLNDCIDNRVWFFRSGKKECRAEQGMFFQGLELEVLHDTSKYAYAYACSSGIFENDTNWTSMKDSRPPSLSERSSSYM